MSIASLYPSINPSLLLDFANVKRLDPRITFTRTTTATYYDGVTAAKAEENLLLQSQTFDNAAWSKTSGSVTANADNAPDGTSTADLFTPSASDARVQQSFFPTGAVQCTCSVWLRSATGSSFSTDLLFWRVSPFSSIATTTITVTTTWQRFTLTATALDATAHAFVIGGGGSLTTGENVYMWGAQAEIRSSVTAYTATTSQAITNYIPVLQTAIAGQARFDHNPTTGESLGLLIEEARTNLATYSADFNNAVWSVVRSSITNNTIVAPDGTLTGDKLVENTDATTTHYIYHGSSLTSATYTASVFVKASERYRFELRVGTQVQGIARFNLSDQTYSNVTAGFTASITAVGNGWYRCSLTGTATTTGGAAWAITILLLNAAGSDSYTGDGFSGLFLWGAQIEAGSFATSYIPTVASTVTRNADAASMTGTNFSSWFGGGNISSYVEAAFKGYVPNQGSIAAQLSDGSTANNIDIYWYNGTPTYYVTAAGAIQVNLPTSVVAANVYTKFSTANAFNDSAVSFNGAAIQTDSSCILPTGLNKLNIGNTQNYGIQYLSGWIKKIAFYPQRLTNTNLVALTT